MTKKKLTALALLLVLGIASVSIAQEPPAAMRVLVVDSTKTFLSTMRVGGLVGALKQVGLFEVDVRLSDVSSSFVDPLEGLSRPSDVMPYAAILVVPRGVDDGSAQWIWVVTDGLDRLSPGERTGVAVISQVVNQVFDGVGTATGVTDDLFPAFLWAVYVQEGWMNE